MSQHLLTVGIAVYSEPDTIWSTLRSLRRHHGYDFDIVVIDNAPQSCQRTKSITLASRGRYFHRPDKNGTSESRNECFRQSKTSWTLVSDAHVLFDLGAIDAMIEYAAANPNSIDLIQGPIRWDDDSAMPAYWRQTTPPGLWGEWAEDQRVKTAMPFEIPMMGLGCFAMRTNAWPGFNWFYRGFGGEEGHIHERVRRFGGKCLCLPALRWSHMFRDEKRIPYPNNVDDHVHNLLVGHRELGIDAVDVILKDFGHRLPKEQFAALVKQSEAEQEFGKLQPFPQKHRILGVWYSNNSAPERLLQHSLNTIKAAADQSWHEVEIVTCPWQAIPKNPFLEIIAKRDAKPGHAQIIAQIRQCIDAAKSDWDAIAFLEHDVLYGPGHFDRIGDAMNIWPNHQVYANQDYIGLGQSGWLAVKELHDPMHQLAMRKDFALENLARASHDCDRQGWALLEPQGDRKDWIRFVPRGFTPSVHVGHKSGRFTSHHEVVFFEKGTPTHPFWGKGSDWWVEADKIEQVELKFNSLEEYYAKVKALPSDFNEHMDTLRRLADDCNVVAELSTWNKPALLALAASKAKSVLSFTSGAKPEWDNLRKFRGDSFVGMGQSNYMDLEIPQRDLLFIDTQHRAPELFALLNKHAPATTKYIVIHCTETFGKTGDDGRDGLMFAINQFLADPKWQQSYQSHHNHGLIVLSRQGVPVPLAKPVSTTDGPGTELKQILSGIGINPNQSCDCNAKAVQMNLWGIEGCKQRRQEIADWLKNGQERWGWRDKLNAAKKATMNGLTFKLNPFDIFGSLVDEAISRAERKIRP